MFCYADVLQRYSECFSTIWLAATKGIKVNRRELLKVEVSQTCGEILDCVTTEVPPPLSHLPSSQFSLYLSSQLQYGVVIAFHRQYGFVLEEAQQTFEMLKRAETRIPIDMPETNRLYLLKEAEGAQDMFFGLMEVDQLPSPYEILQAEFVIKARDSQHSLVPRPHTTLDMDAFRSPPAAITMRETEQCVITTDEYFEGDDLEATTREIDMLMDQPEHFDRGSAEVEEIRGCEAPMSSIDQLKGTDVGSEQDSVFILDMKSGDLETTPQVNMPTPPCAASGKEGSHTSERSYGEQVVVRPKGKPVGGRKRQLASANPQIQIASRTMMEQIGNPLVETRKLSEALLASPAVTERQTPAQLFSSSYGYIWQVKAATRQGLIYRPGHVQRKQVHKRCHHSSQQTFEAVPFEPLLPPEADRSTAAHAFNRLLGLLSAGQVKVHQTEPYGDITMNPPAV